MKTDDFFETGQGTLQRRSRDGSGADGAGTGRARIPVFAGKTGTGDIRPRHG